jgi:hypothetical protein
MVFFPLKIWTILTSISHPRCSSCGACKLTKAYMLISWQPPILCNPLPNESIRKFEKWMWLISFIILAWVQSKLWMFKHKRMMRAWDDLLMRIFVSNWARGRRVDMIMIIFETIKQTNMIELQKNDKQIALRWFW